jgi:hypothetical protein
MQHKKCWTCHGTTMVSYNKSPDETIQANLPIFFSPLYHGEINGDQL